MHASARKCRTVLRSCCWRKCARRIASAATSQAFVAGMTDLPEAARSELAAMTPSSYTGNAADQAKALARHLAGLRAQQQ